MSLITLQNVSVGYDKSMILKNFNLNIEKGEFVSLLGPSGCGKTTTLRLIAGFLEATDGKFLFNGKDYTRVPVSRRNFGFVFQSYALFPHLSIFDNVAFGLKLRKVNNKEIKQRVMDILETVDLIGFENRFPSELSGGQRQRVAIARALVIKPDLLLFDEPLSNLDANLRVNMRVEIRKIQQELGITTVYVSHDQEECFSISDKVAVMNKGIIEQLDKPSTIYKFPKTEFVARFIGFNNFIHFTEVEQRDAVVFAKAGNGSLFHIIHKTDIPIGKQMKGAIRPDDILIGKDGEFRNHGNRIEGKVKITTFLGRSYQNVVKTDLGEFVVNREMESHFHQNEKVQLVFPKEKMVLIPDHA